VSRGWFSIERIGFLARSAAVTFVAHVMIFGRTQGFLRLIVVGARTFDDNLRALLRLHALDGGESAEELIGDVAENCSTASGDAILDLEDDEPGEEVIDAIETVEVVGIFEEFGREVRGLQIFGKSGVPRAETGVGVGDEFAAASAI
jgi:hypothetical protein